MSDNEMKVVKLMLIPEFEDAMIGVARHNGNNIAVYDMNACIEIMIDGGLEAEDAARILTDKIDSQYRSPEHAAFVWSYSDVIKRNRDEILLSGNN